MPGRDATNALDRRLDLRQVGHRLDPDEVHASGDERLGLLGEEVHGVVVVEGPGRGHDGPARSDVPGDEGLATIRVHLGAKQDGRRLVEFGDPRVEAV